MATVSVIVCDICESAERVKGYKVEQDGRRARVDLCVEHAAPLEDMLKVYARPAGSRGRPRQRRAAAKVTTMEEIEKLKH